MLRVRGMIVRMRRLRPLASALALLGVVLLVAAACGGPTPGADASSPSDAAATDAATGPVVQIGTRESGAVFTPWHDGEVVPMVYGPQGGVMITPAVAIDGSLVSGTDPGLDVVLSNLVLPDRVPLGEFPGYGPVHSLFARLDTLLVNGPIFDQIGWTPPASHDLVVRARVMGPGLDAHGEVQIVLSLSSAPPPDAGAFDGTADADVPDAGP